MSCRVAHRDDAALERPLEDTRALVADDRRGHADNRSHVGSRCDGRVRGGGVWESRPFALDGRVDIRVADGREEALEVLIVARLDCEGLLCVGVARKARDWEKGSSSAHSAQGP